MKTNLKTTKRKIAKLGAVKVSKPKKEAAKKAVASLAELQSKFRNPVELLPQVIYTSEIGVNGGWEYVSPQIENLLGFSADECSADATPGKADYEERTPFHREYNG